MGEKKESKLPKNVKQIGQVPNGQKIYIEDYVITYLKQMLEQEKEMRVSVLYGHKEIIENEMYWFVNGAIEAETDFFMHKTILSEESWEKVNDLARRFFDDMAVLGWAIARPESTDSMQEQVIRTQKTFFRLDQKLYFEYITDENKEDIFLYEKGKFKKQSGYYVYYDKNECMQNYMVSLRAQERHPEEFEADRTMQQIRENREEKKQQRSRQRTTTLLTCFSMILVTTIMIIGITMLNNYEKMESMERVLNQISGKMEQAVDTNEVANETQEVLGVQNQNLALTQQEDSPVMTDGQVVLSQEDQNIISETGNTDVIVTDTESDGNQIIEEIPESDDSKTDTENAEKNESNESQPDQTMTEESGDTQEIAEVPEVQEESNAAVNHDSRMVYIIKEGDTLATICLQYYGSLSRIDEICSINNIENKDNIYYGQKIYLP